MAAKPSYLTPGLQVPILVDGKPVMAKYLEWSDKKEIMIVEYMGRRLWRSPRSTMGANGEKIVGLNSASGAAEMKARGQAALSTTIAVEDYQAPEPEPSRFDINTRFQFLDALVDMVVIGNGKSLIVTGEGGLGKSFTVIQRLQIAGLKEVQEDEETGETIPGDYLFVKGFTTAKTLYRTLYDNRDEGKIVIFDDTDSALKDKTAVNILKAALDSYGERTISWLSELTKNDDELPSRFKFQGKVIFISNLRLDELPQPIISRASYVDVSMGSKDKLERMRTIAHASKFIMPSAEEIEKRVSAYKKQIHTELTKDEKEEALQLIENNAAKIGDLNMRTYLKVAEIHMHTGKRWADIAEYVVTAF